MLGRLGRVLYWAGCGVSALCVAAMVVAAIVGPRPDDGINVMEFLPLAMIAIASWLLDRACKYVLAGR
ncbi:hypothetical protein FW320_29400 [Azospirillum sp. Vi22]|uniref:hypothetical protein n=1 Tax=Azospirillum baldaniorum TaxID=1064539 RepID=UPI00157B8277|nr:hypothetical protein [Azospirillum baldaniorum]NUB10265.1 hypothetical protein [Azospirillum baldaniorum]